MDDEQIRLILDLGNSGKNAAEVRVELERLNDATRTLGASYEVLAISGQGYELGEERITIAHTRQKQAMEASAKAARDLATAEHSLANEAMDEVVRKAVEQTQAQKAMNLILAESTTRTSTAAVGFTKVGSASKESSQGILRASYAIQDFTSVLAGGGGFARALSSVQNNVPGVLASLGTGAGIAGVVSIAAVGVGVLIENFGKLKAAWSGGETDDEAGRMERLAKASKEAAAAIQAQVTAMRDREGRSSEAAEIANAAISQAGGVDVAVNAVQRQIQSESGLGQQREELRKAEALQQRYEERKRSGLGTSANAVAELSEATARTDKAREAVKKSEDEARERAQALVVDASKGGRTAIAELARRFPGEAFGQATPEAIRAQNDEVDASEEQGARLSRGNAKRRGQNARADALNRAGQENEAFAANEAAEGKAKDIDKVLKGLDKVIATGDKALADDPKGDARRADIRERAGYGLDFKEFAGAQGFSPLKSDLADAARSIQADVKDGFSEEEAMQSALQKLLYAVNKGIEVNNKRAMTARRFVAGVDNLPPILDEGNW